MSYCFSRQLDLSFDDAIKTVTEALAKEGFGIISEINVTDTLRKKIGVEFRPYKILGACNPTFAHRAIEAEANIGVMMPCNVVVQEMGSGVQVAAINPLTAMQAVKNADLEEFATAISAKLQRVIDSL
ncbi:MAG: DUF302 domain-containing protein [Gammaproteobacteria bacterium]